MKKSSSAAVVALFMLRFSSVASAQTPPPGTPGNPTWPSNEAPVQRAEALVPPADVGSPAEIPPTPPPGAMPSEPGPPPVEDRVAGLEAQVAGLDESLAATKASVDKLSKIKVSGYLQGRFEYHADSTNGLTSAGRPGATDRFLVRRGRLKTSYDGTNAEYVLQIDATGDGVVLKDAEATFVDTWSPFGLRLTVGQFKWPFGYEILQSSGDREMPERSFMIRRLFPGERDRGLRVQGKYQWLRLAAALVNGVRELPAGSPAQDSIYGTNDENSFKDVVGRIGGDFEFVVVGLSGYFGRILKTTSAAALTPKWTDANMDKMITADEITFTAPTATSYQRFSRKRIGVDAQVYLDVPGLGGLALKAELIYAKDTNLDYQGKPADSCQDITSFGGIVTVVQNIGDNVGAVVRYDSFDPNFSKALDSRCTAQITAGQGDRQDTLGVGLLFHASANMKGTFVYEHVAEQSVTKSNDVFTAQLQARF